MNSQRKDSKEGDSRNDSLIVRLRCGELTILLLPHIGAGLAQQLSALPLKSFQAEVLVMPLGGSDLMETLRLIRKIAPRIVISRVDVMNRDGIPSREWESLFAAEKITLLRQDETGAVIIDADPSHPEARTFLPPQTEIPLSNR